MSVKELLFCHILNSIHRIAYTKDANKTEESVNQSEKQSKDSIILFAVIIIAIVVITIIFSVFAFTRGRMKGRAAAQREKSRKREKSEKSEKSETNGKIETSEKSEQISDKDVKSDKNDCNNQIEPKEQRSKSANFISLKNWKSHVPRDESQVTVRSVMTKQLIENEAEYEPNQNSIESLQSIEARKQFDLQKTDKRSKRVVSHYKWGL